MKQQAFRRLAPALVIGALGALALAGTALAAPAIVDLRIEGRDGTHFEGRVVTDTRTVNGGDGTGAHRCDGTNGGAGGRPGPTAGSALADAAQGPHGFLFAAGFNDGFDDFLIGSLGGETPDFAADGTFWAFYTGAEFAQKGVCGTRVRGGERALLARSDGAAGLLRLAGPARARRGAAMTVAVTDATSGAVVEGASVGGATTNAEGKATVTYDMPGVASLKAQKAGTIRSNAVLTCVYTGNAGSCERSSARVAIGSIEDAERFSVRSAPRRITGTSRSGKAGPAIVQVKLERKLGTRCWALNASGKLVRARCGTARFVPVTLRGRGSVGAGAWSIDPGRRMLRGRYRLDAVATDALRRRTELERGQSSVAFAVTR